MEPYRRNPDLQTPKAPIMYEHFKFLSKLLLALGVMLMGWDLAQAQSSDLTPRICTVATLHQAPIA